MQSSLSTRRDGLRSSADVMPSDTPRRADGGTLVRILAQLSDKADNDPLVRSRVQGLIRVAYGLPSSEGGSPSHNPLLLGAETVKGLTLGVAALTAAQQRDLAVDDHWQHAIATALTARELARRVGVRDRDRAFVAGFLHDIGLLVPPATELAAVTDARHLPDHPATSALLTERWGLAPELAQAIRDHHDAQLPYVMGQAALLTRTLQVADWLAGTQAIASPGDPAAHSGAPSARADLRLDDDALEQLCLGLGRRVSQVCDALGLKAVSEDLAARALFRLQLRRAGADAMQAHESSRQTADAPLAALIGRVAEALLECTSDQERLTAYCLAAVGRLGVERVRCGLSVSGGEAMAVSCAAADPGTAQPELRCMSLEAWRAIVEDRVSTGCVGHAFLALGDGRRLDLLVRVDPHTDRDAVMSDLDIALRLLGLALGQLTATPSRESANGEGTAAASGESQPASTASQNDALRILGEMAGGAAHDVNNALAVVLGQAQLGQVAESVLEARGHFAAIERASRDCASMVRRLQEFARNSRRPRVVGDVDLAALARETLELTRPTWKDGAQRRGASIRTVLDLPAPVPVKADAGALRQVVTNLILNALDAMPAGGTLSLKAWSDGKHAQLSVSDTGAGMSEDTLSRVFEPFFTTKREEGTGLGLAVSKRIIHEYDGDIRVTSRPGLGSVFTISLPCADQTAEARPTEPATSLQRALRVLLIDDEPQVREVLIRMLRLDGHQAVAASTASEGLDLLEQESFDLVMTDLGLPDMPGWQLARAAKDGDRHVPVILVTGWTEDGDRPAPVEGVDAVLAKPFGMVELRRVVKAATDGCVERDCPDLAR